MSVDDGGECMSTSEPATEMRVMRDGDVYAFAYNEDSWRKAREGWAGSLHHCFDGQLVFRGSLLCDTYWGLDARGYDGRSFGVDEALSEGTLTFICNLNDVETIPPYDYQLYAEGDAFDLSYQHGCYKHFVKRKGARKDPKKMLDALQNRVDHLRSELSAAESRLEWARREQGRLTPKILAGEEVTL